MSPPFHTAPGNEVADHVVTGTVVLLVSLWALWRAPRGAVEGPGMLVVGMVIVLAGLWMVATHAPLLAQAWRHQAPWPASAYHCASAVSVMVFGLIWAVWYWDPDHELPPDPRSARSRHAPTGRNSVAMPNDASVRPSGVRPKSTKP